MAVRAARRVAGCLVIGMALAACGAPGQTPPSTTTGPAPTPGAIASPSATPSPSPSPTSTPTPGGTDAGIHTPEGWPFALTLPAGWQWAWDATSYEALLDALDPARRAALESFGSPETQSEFSLVAYAVDLGSDPLPGGGLTMALVNWTDAGVRTLGTLEADLRAAVEASSNAMTIVTLRRVALAAGPALRIDLRWRRTGSTGSEVGLVACQLIEDGELWDVGFLTSIEDAEGRRADWDSILETFRLVPASPTPAP